MKEKPLSKATRTVYTILRQIATLIPREFTRDALRRSISGESGETRIRWSAGRADLTLRSPQSCTAIERVAGAATASPAQAASVESSRRGSICGSNAAMSASARNAATATIMRISPAASKSASRRDFASADFGLYAPRLDGTLKSR